MIYYVDDERREREELERKLKNLTECLKLNEVIKMGGIGFMVGAVTPTVIALGASVYNALTGNMNQEYFKSLLEATWKNHLIGGYCGFWFGSLLTLLSKEVKSIYEGIKSIRSQKS